MFSIGITRPWKLNGPQRGTGTEGPSTNSMKIRRQPADGLERIATYEGIGPNHGDVVVHGELDKILTTVEASPSNNGDRFIYHCFGGIIEQVVVSTTAAINIFVRSVTSDIHGIFVNAKDIVTPNIENNLL